MLNVHGIPVGNVRSMGHLAPWFYLHWFHGFLFRCLIFNWYNISICKKEKLKDETSKKNFVKPMEVNKTCNSFTNFFSVSSLIVTTSGFVKRERSKMRHLKKFVKPNGGQIKGQDVPLHWPKFPRRYGSCHFFLFQKLLPWR